MWTTQNILIVVAGLLVIIAGGYWLLTRFRWFLSPLHPKLKPFAGSRHIGSFDRAVKRAQKELARQGCDDFEVDVIAGPHQYGGAVSSRPVRVLADEELVIKGTVDGREFRIVRPIIRWRFMAIKVNIRLNVEIRFAATARRGLLRWQWEVEPESPRILELLSALRLPKVRSRHMATDQVSEIYREELPFAHRLQPDPDDPARTLWTILAGNQGAVFRHKQKLAPFFEAASDIEQALKAFAPASAETIETR